MPGYLTLHQTAHSLNIKWTPNQLMNRNADNDLTDKRYSVAAVVATLYIVT